MKKILLSMSAILALNVFTLTAQDKIDKLRTMLKDANLQKKLEEKFKDEKLTAELKKYSNLKEDADNILRKITSNHTKVFSRDNLAKSNISDETQGWTNLLDGEVTKFIEEIKFKSKITPPDFIKDFVKQSKDKSVTLTEPYLNNYLDYLKDSSKKLIRAQFDVYASLFPSKDIKTVDLKNWEKAKRKIVAIFPSKIKDKSDDKNALAIINLQELQKTLQKFQASLYPTDWLGREKLIELEAARAFYGAEILYTLALTLDLTIGKLFRDLEKLKPV